ncbi:MAG: DALR domain-containing protein, partial [Bacteroidota bacterium]
TPVFNLGKFYSDFETVMDDDFNTPQAVAVIFDFVRTANKIIDENPNTCKTFLMTLKEFLKKTAEEVLGVIHFEDLNKRITPALENELINLILNLREELKKEKNYKLADQVRNKLNELGLIVQDSKTGPAVKRK